MSLIPVQISSIQKAIYEVCHSLEQSCSSVINWDCLPEEELWRELVACILGSRVSYNITHAAIERLAKATLFSKEKRSSHFQEYEEALMQNLSSILDSDENKQSPLHYPFPRLRAKQIRTTAEVIYGKNRSLRCLLNNVDNVYHARQRLVAEVSGIGPKQASLFLRNIGYTDELAVLDTHILTYLSWIGLIPTSVKSIPTLKKYEEIENEFIGLAYSNGFQTYYFDLAVWVVIRLVKKEYKKWH